MSGAFERFLIARGERVVRVAPKHMAGARRSSRETWQVGLDRRVQRRSRCAEGRDREPPRRAPGRRGARHSPAGRPSRRSDRRTHRRPAAAALASARHVARARDPGRGAGHQQVAWEDLPPPRPRPANDARAGRARARASDHRAHHPIRELQAELAALVESYAPQLLAERGCGPLTAAKLIGEIAGADRFATDAKLARTGGAAPIPASSGNTSRHRLDRGGNRQLNCALHRLAVNKANWDADTPPTSNANRPRESRARKRCAASSATSPAASGGSRAARDRESINSLSPIDEVP